MHKSRLSSFVVSGAGLETSFLIQHPNASPVPVAPMVYNKGVTSKNRGVASNKKREDSL